MKFFVYVSLIVLPSTAILAQAPANQNSDSTTQTPYENKNDVSFQKLDDMTLVAPTDIPEGLLTTLKRPEYEGWEKNELYRSSDGRIYELRVGKGKKAKRHQFDAEGNPIKE